MAFLVVAHVENTLLQHVTESEYDLSNRPSRVKTHKVTKDDAGNITSEHIYTGEVAYDDAFGRLTEFNEKVGATHTAYTTTFGYDEENRPTSLEYGSYGESTIEYDGLGRVAKTTVKAGSGAEASTAYTYVDGAVLETEAPDDADDERKEAAANAAGKTSTTGLVQSITQTGGNFTYTYDDNGNITKVVQDGVTTSYTYDALGQLIQVDDGQENATWVYEYDQGGNILSKKKYALNVTSGTPVESKTFTYGNANWKDQLTAVNGTPITYDNIGNPLNDGTWQYEWVNGRQLARMHSVDTDASFVYNENGLRVQKTVNGVVTKYTLYGKNIVHMTQGSNELHFFYDSQGKPAVVVYNDTPYSYVKNLQGDIVAILNSAGTIVVSYKYDAWGKPISKTGSMASTLGKINPFRYRGYVYDEEMGLYYLRSRYYNPNWCRFVCSDVFVGRERLLAHNVFSYCRNMVICHTDPNGLEDNGTWPLRKTPVWGEALDGQKMPVWYLVAGLHAMVKEGWIYSPSMDYGRVDCIGGARFMGQQFFKTRSILDKNIRQKVSFIRDNNLSRLETINPQNLEEIPYGAFLFTAPNEKGKRHMGYYIGAYNGVEHCIIETTGKGDVMHYENLETRLRDDEEGKGFIEWGLWNCVDYDAVDIPESVPAFEFMF